MNTNLTEIKKYIGSCCGNTFVILDCRGLILSRELKSKYALNNLEKLGVDSALFIEHSNSVTRMRIFEKDGSESDSCGNGAILVSYLLGIKKGVIEMKDGSASVIGDTGKQSISMNLKISNVKRINNNQHCLFVKFGEPHLIYWVDDIEKFDLSTIGKEMQKKYQGGVNVDAVQKISENLYLIKTYERGVFAETKSCGTGSLSSCIAISYLNGKLPEEPIELRSAGGSHWVSKHENMLKLEVSKEACKIVSLDMAER